MKYIKPLVAIYARQTVEEVTNQPALIENAIGVSLQELSGGSAFPVQQEFVKTLKLRIEAQKKDLEQADVKAQIGHCLRVLFVLVLFDRADRSTVDLKMDTMRDLLVAMYADDYGWSADQRAHFEFVFQRLKGWNSYFLSYTNEGGKAINAKYRDVIDLFTEPDVLKDRNRDIHNVLADTIVNSLRKRSLSRRSFYDKEKIKLGDNLDAEIAPAATNTFAFVQLVQLETFDTSRPVNWSYKEYHVFQTQNELEVKDRARYKDVFAKRFVPILVGEQKDIQPAILPWEFGPWTSLIFTATRYLPVPATTDAFQNTMRQLGESIVNLAYQIIDNVPP